MKKLTFERVFSYLKLCLEAIITGVVIGFVVGLYQLGIQYVVKGSKYMYSSRDWWMIAIMVVIVGTLALVNDIIIKYAPGVDGSGIPNMELGIRHVKPINWNEEISLMIANSYISTFAGFTLGSEGPSVVVSGKIAKMTRDISGVGDDDSIAMACGTGFGCAFLSPLAGICYIFEESLHKFHPQLLFRAILMMGSAICCTSLVNHHHLLEVETVIIPNIGQYYVFAILVVINALIGMGFVKAIVALKKYLAKHGNEKKLKYRGYIMFAITLILNFVCLGYMGAGTTLVGNMHLLEAAWLVILVLILRFVMTVISGSGKVTGGLVVPIMTLGALTGQLVMVCCNHWFGLSMEIAPIINLVSMCMIFGVVTKTPITSIALVYSALCYSTGDYLHSLIIIPVVTVAIFLAFFISKWCKVDCLYEQFMEITLENDKNANLEAK